MPHGPTLGLHPTVWRKLRAKHPGLDLTVYDRQGHSLGVAYLWRYDALISLPLGMDFNAIGWKQTIQKATPPIGGILGPTPIAIGRATWGF